MLDLNSVTNHSVQASNLKRVQIVETFEKVFNYYQQFDEWQRLNSSSGQLELLTTLAIISNYFPKNAHILDLGSGPGRYALEFCRLGHRVTLADISPKLIMRAKKIFAQENMIAQEFKVANAIDLSYFANNTFDAIFCSGPFYHLVEANHRLQAAKEIIRTCKPDSCISIGFLPQSSGIAGLISRAVSRKGQVTCSNFKLAAETGIFTNGSADGFQEGYFAGVDSFKEFWSGLGIADIKIFSTRTFMHHKEEEMMQIKASDPQLFDLIFDAHLSKTNEQGLVELGGHALLVGRVAK